MGKGVEVWESVRGGAGRGVKECIWGECGKVCWGVKKCVERCGKEWVAHALFYISPISLTTLSHPTFTHPKPLTTLT